MANINVIVTINGQTIAVQVPPIIGIEITPNPIPYVQQNSNWDSVSGVTEILNKPILGTASALDVPVTGNASATEVVLGNDTRLHPAGGAVTSVTASSPLLSSGGLDPNISIPAATSLVDGYATSTQIAKLDGIQSGATQYTDELAQDAVGGILTNTGNVQFVYDDVTPKITASVDLSGKQDVLGFTPVPDTRTVNGHALSTDVTVSKSDVGLSNVDDTSDANKPISSATQTALDGKVDENFPITGATNTKITFDSKGLVTSGSNATTADIADSLDKRYVTDSNLTTIGNQSGTNTGDITLGTASGLSLLSQQLSLGLASSGVTGALSGTDWSTFNNKVSLTGDETVAGIKTFSSFPVTPSSLPTLDYQVSNKAYVDTKVPYTVLTDTKDPTGWADPIAVEAAMTYDSATQTISITGTHYYYWRGVKSSVTNFVSTPHANVVGATYFLSSVDGINFTWDTLPWSFDAIMVASVNYQTAYKYAISECHGLMPWEAHEEFHRTIGTYKESGGTLDPASYTLASTTAVNRRPNVFQTIIHDEDIEHTLVTLTSKLYNKFTLSGTGIANFSGETADIIPLLGNNPYYNSFTTPNWTQTLVPNNAYTCVWLVGQPVTKDVNSQGFRYFWVQGQSQGSLTTMQGLTPGDVSFGTLSSQVEELVFLVKIIVRYTGGNWVLTNVTNLNGNRFIQTGTIAGTYLSSVTTNGSLTGDGSTGNPLSASSGATTVTAGATTTLTVTSATIQEFTGTTTQTVVLPVVTTLRLGHQFTIANHSTGSITLNSSGGNLVGTITAGNTLVVRCILLTGTTDASWDSDYLVQPTEYVGNGTGNFVRTTSPVLVTPSLGVATATTINGNTITAGTGTLSLSTFTLTVPASMTTAGRNVTNTFTEVQTIQKAVASGSGGMIIFDRIASTNQSFITMTTGATGEFFMGVPADLSNMVVFGSGNGGSVSASLAITKTTGFHFGDYTTAIVAPTAWVQITAPAGTARALDVAWGGKTIVMGAELDSSARRDAQAKYTQVGSVHYTNAEEPVGVYIAGSTSTTNNLVLGGGNGSFNTMTNLYFYAAANNTTLTGTQQMHIKFGEVIIGAVTTGAGRFSILGTTDVIQSVTRGHSTQTASLAEWQSSASAVYVKISGTGVFFPRQATTATAPAYVLGGMYYDTTLNKLRIGGATAWETVTSS